MKIEQVFILCFLIIYLGSNVSSLGIECFETQSTKLYCNDGVKNLNLSNFTNEELSPEEKSQVYSYIDLLFYGSIFVLFIVLVGYLIIRRMKKRG